MMQTTTGVVLAFIFERVMWRAYLIFLGVEKRWPL